MRLKLKLQYFGHLMQRAMLEKTLMLGKTEGRRAQQKMSWLHNITDSRDMSLSKLWETVKDREAWHAAAHGVPKSQTQLSDWKTSNCISRAEARDAAKYLTVHGTAPTGRIIQTQKSVGPQIF